jgi:hypothetical protein
MRRTLGQFAPVSETTPDGPIGVAVGDLALELLHR